MLPLAIVLGISTLRRSLKEAHHSALALYSGYEFNAVATSGHTPMSSLSLGADLSARLYQVPRGQVSTRLLLSMSVRHGARDLHGSSSCRVRRSSFLSLRPLLLSLLWLHLPHAVPCWQESLLRLLGNFPRIWHPQIASIARPDQYITFVPIDFHRHVALGRSLASSY